MNKSTLQCSQCSGVSFTQISDTHYRCEYCGSITIVEGSKPGSAASPAMRVQKKRSWLIPLLAASLFIILGTTTAILLLEPGSGPAVSKRICRMVGAVNHPAGESPRGKFYRISRRQDVLGNIYFFGWYRNTGTVPIIRPRITLFCCSNTGRKVAAGRGYSARENLLPGEETPIRVLVHHPAQCDSIKVIDEPRAPYRTSDLRRPSMTFRNVRLIKSRYSGYEITGELANNDGGSVKSLRVAGILTNANGRIIGYDSSFVSSTPLAPGDYSPFLLRFLGVKKVPASYSLEYSCHFTKRMQ
ncbi:MAG: hypothetical protein JXA20_17235 [Spirochaetes bacterium]|nr:hypothetical protein [Spirochaetota bacterium]